MLQTRSLLKLFVLAFAFSSLLLAEPRGGPKDGGAADKDDGGTDNDGDGTPTTSTTNSTAGAGGVGANSTVGAGLNGDSACPGSQLMCVTAFVNGSTVTYELQSTGAQTFGWMAIGFGSQMANTPMVIMWPNTDGTVILSQRKAPQEVMPTVDPSPPNVATAQNSLSVLTGNNPKMVFTVPGSATQVPLIWAFGTTRPAASVSATLLQHVDSGAFQLDLTKTIPSSQVNGNSTTTPAGSSGGSHSIPYLKYEKTIIAHASVVAVGFLVLLPGGVFLARYTRTWNNRWFTGHWIIQSGIGGIFVIVGIILGFVAVHQHGVDIPSRHKNIGKVLLALYLAQCFLGAFIHFFKIRVGKLARPPQNYLHAVLGLAIIGLAFYQVWLGFEQEWPNMTGRGDAPRAVLIVWIIWAVAVALIYALGLAFLPRQFRQESASRAKTVPSDPSYRDAQASGIHTREPSHEMQERTPFVGGR